MREDFQAQMEAIRGALVDMTGSAGTAIVRATQALLNQDLAAADEVASLTIQLDAARRAVEDRTYELLARQQPVAGDLRNLVSAIRIGADIDRMGSLANHIAKVAKLRHPAPAVPSDIAPVFGEMGAVARRMAEGTGIALSNPDATEAERLQLDDDAMDALHRKLFRLLLDDEWEHGVESAIDVALLGRYYERFADHLVAIAETVVYLVTGELPVVDRTKAS